MVLRWLIEVEDGPEAHALYSGGTLLQLASRLGRVDSEATGWNALAGRVAALKADGSVRYTYDKLPGEPGEPPAPVFSHTNLQRCREISVTSAGRMAARDDRPTISITGSTVRNVAGRDITEVNVTGLFEQWEAAIDEVDASPAAKEEAKGRLRQAKELLLDAGSGATGGVIAQALSHMAGL